MQVDLRNDVMSDDPADARRLMIPGSLGVKLATDGNGNEDETKYTSTKAEKLSLRPKHRIGTWNVRGLLTPGKLTVVEKEMVNYDIAVLGLCEMHIKGAGHFRSTTGNTVYFSGHDNESRNGVGFIVPAKLNSSVSGYNPVNDRIITMRLDCKPLPLNIIQVYAPTAQSSEEDIDDFYNKLELTISGISKREVLIIQGDWNAKVGVTMGDDHLRHVVGRHGIGVRNERGERFLDFCVSHNLTVTNTCFKHHIRRLWTWQSPGNRYKNQIDYIAVPNRWKSSVSNARTFPGADCGSDHQLLVADLRARFRTQRKGASKSSRLSYPATDFFQKKVEEKLLQETFSTTTQDDPEELWRILKSNINNTLSLLPTSPYTRKDWIADDTWQLIQERKQLKCRNLPERRVLAYSDLNRRIQRMCRRDKNQLLEKMCKDIEAHADKYQTADLFKKIRQVTREFKPKSWIINDKQGNPVLDVNMAAERWCEYCSELYKDPCTDDRINTRMRTATEVEPEILRSEVEDAIRKLKRHKAPGADLICAETLKALGELGVNLLHRVCNAVWKTCKWPTDWTHSAIIPLHKKGSVRECSNHRTLALISHASKILLHIINSRLRSFLDWQIPQEQAGFVKGKGTREQILNLRLIVEKCYEFNTTVVMCFVDYQKAFDCVRWRDLWSVLSELGVPDHLVRLIDALYEASHGTVTVGNATSSKFHFEKGVRQGCVISPILFNIYGEYIMRKALDGWEGGICIGGSKISNLRYADDTTLFASSEEEMFLLLQRLENASSMLGLSINRGKTKVMTVDRSSSIQSTTLLHNYEQVQEFQYLGSLITNNGSCEKEIRRRIAMAKTAMTKLDRVWRDRNISNHTKVYMVQTLVFSVFLYASETWTLKATDHKRVDAFEMWCWRRLLGISWTAHRTNISILKDLKLERQQRLSSVCLSRVLKYFGHIARRKSGNLEKLVLTGKLEGKRPRGRIPKRWSDQVTNSLNMPMSVSLHQAEDRAAWRRLLNVLGRDHDPQ